VGAIIFDVLASMKNKDKARGPDMHQMRKGNQWYLGMKTYIGVDHQTRLIHSAAVTAANIHDSQILGDLLYGDETRIWGDSTYAKPKIRSGVEHVFDVMKCQFGFILTIL